MTYRTSIARIRNVRRTEYGGRTYDSQFEASVAAELDVRLRAGEIAGWEPQYRIECIPYDCHGTAVPQCKVTHRVDFRVHELDGSYTLVEAKGMETDDYKRRRKWLEHFWLPAHPDHNYEVVRMSRYRGRSRGGSFRG